MPTLDLQVGAGADDGRNQGTHPLDNPRTTSFSFLATGTALSFGTITSGGSSYRRADFNRFTNVTVPAGATIDVSYITYTGKEGETTAVELVIEAVDADNPAAPTTGAEYTAQAFTTASVTWDFSDTWTDGVEFNSPSINTVIQELVDRAGWASGQAMITCTIDDLNVSSDRRRQPYSYNGSTTKAVKLHIEYTEAGGAARRIFVVS